MQDIVERVSAHAKEFADVRPASCELLRECAVEIGRLRLAQQAWEKQRDEACARIGALRNCLALGFYPLSAIGARIDELCASLDRVVAQDRD